MQRRIRITDPAKTYFISDPHFNHKHPAILSAAGVKTVEELNAKRVALWNAAVPVDGVVFMLGDFCLHDPTGHVTRVTLKQLHGKEIYLLWGNHNSGVKHLYRKYLTQQFFGGDAGRGNNYEVYPLRFSLGSNSKQIIFVGDYQELLWRRGDVDHKIILSHYAHRAWLHAHRGSWMLCGHSHGNDRATASPTDAGLGKIQEVTFEAIGQPKNCLELDAIMAWKPSRADHRSTLDDDTDDE